MSAPEQQSTVAPSPHEQESKTVAEKGPKIPESTEPFSEQRAFIDLLTDDDEQKQ